MTNLNTNTPTQKYLASLGACSEAREWVGNQDLVTAWNSCTRLDWLQGLLEAPIGAEYDRAMAPIQAEYERAVAPIRAEYQRAAAPIYAEYRRAMAPIEAEYERAVAPIRAEYRRAMAPIGAEYRRAMAPIDACRTCDELRQKFACPKVI